MITRKVVWKKVRTKFDEREKVPFMAYYFLGLIPIYSVQLDDYQANHFQNY